MRINTKMTKLLCITVAASLIFIATSITAMASGSCDNWCQGENANCEAAADNAYDVCWDQCIYYAYIWYGFCIAQYPYPPYSDMCYNTYMVDYFINCTNKNIEFFYQYYYEDYSQYELCEVVHEDNNYVCSIRLSNCQDSCVTCGDDLCDPYETCETCPEDCEVCP